MGGAPFKRLNFFQVVPGALVVKDQKSLHETTDFTSHGTLAYVTDDESLMVRVPQGWQYVGVRCTIRFKNV